jgi:hypothetical protein
MVVVQATLDAAGNVDDARVLSGPAELRRVALQSVLQWHFLPGKEGSVRQVSVQFQLAEAQRREKEEPAWGFADLAEEGERKKAERKPEAPGTIEAVFRLEAQIQELKARMAREQASREQLQDPESRYKAQIVLAELESQVAERERELASQRTAPDSQADQLRAADEAKAEAQILELRRRAEAEGVLSDVRVAITSQVPLGRTVTSIDVVGLTDPVRAQLLSRLPVHAGDTLSRALLERLEKAIRNFDEHLEMNLERQEDGQGAALRITAPNAGGFFTLRVK